MASRVDLQNKLVEILGSKQVYYQPPASTKIEYTAIVYSRSNIESRYANDAKYSMKNKYELIVISKRPDDPVIIKLLELPYCSHDRQYKSDNLYHDSLTLYY